jgi:hypothetical protein
MIRMKASQFSEVLMNAVIRSNRWKKWLLVKEKNKDFCYLDPMDGLNRISLCLDRLGSFRVAADALSKCSVDHSKP